MRLLGCRDDVSTNVPCVARTFVACALWTFFTSSPHPACHSLQSLIFSLYNKRYACCAHAISRCSSTSCCHARPPCDGLPRQQPSSPTSRLQKLPSRELHNNITQDHRTPSAGAADDACFNQGSWCAVTGSAPHHESNKCSLRWYVRS